MTEAQRTVHHDKRKKGGNGLFLIHQCVDPSIFEKIIDEDTAKGAWHTLKKFYGGDKKLKKVKVQGLKKQYENTKMKEDESITKFSSRLVLLTNKMKTYGETITNLQKID